MPRRGLRRVARTAVVVGGVTAVAGSRKNKKAAAEQQAESDEQMDQMQSDIDEMKTQESDPAPAASSGDMMSELEQLGELHSSGVLTDDEFTAAKAKILG